MFALFKSWITPPHPVSQQSSHQVSQPSTGSQACACRTNSLICKAKDKMKVQDSLLKVKISRCRWQRTKPSLCACMPVHFSRVQLSVIPWTIARQASLSMGFSRQEYWRGLPFPPPGTLLDPGIEPVSLMSPALVGWFLTTSVTWEAQTKHEALLNMPMKVSLFCFSRSGGEDSEFSMFDLNDEDSHSGARRYLALHEGCVLCKRK